MRLLRKSQKELSGYFKAILETVFPWNCVVCERLSEAAICPPCIRNLEPATEKCPECRGNSPFGLTHPGCRTRYGLNGCLSSFAYQKARLDRVIIAGKYGFQKTVFVLLAEATAEWLVSNNLNQKFNKAVVVPVPLNRRRQRWRGFNQAEILSTAIAERLGLEIAKALIRNKNTKTQKDLGKLERQKNIADAFSLSKSKNPWHSFLIKNYPVPIPVNLQGATILLVDDVFTTGSTLKEASKVLKKAGATEVWGLTVASD